MNTAEIYKACGSNKAFGGVYAKDTFMQASKQKKLYVVNTDPSWSPGEHWFVVDHTQEPCMYGEEEDKFSLCKSNYYLPTSGFILLLLLHNHLQTAAEQPKNTLGNRNRDITQLSAG